MMNVAYSERYRIYREQCQAIFTPDHLLGHQPNSQPVGMGLWIHTWQYEGYLEWPIHGSKNQLVGEDGAILHTWWNLNRDGAFCRLFTHQNGGTYLLYREDLYGYSVWERASGRTLQFLPLEAFPADQKDFRETFIWTDVLYDPVSNLLAVSGCYWAAPTSVVILDFTNPMAEQDRWLDVMGELVGNGYDRFDDVGPVKFAEGMLELSAIRAEDGSKQCLLLSTEQIRTKLAETSN